MQTTSAFGMAAYVVARMSVILEGVVCVGVGRARIGCYDFWKVMEMEIQMVSVFCLGCCGMRWYQTSKNYLPACLLGCVG